MPVQRGSRRSHWNQRRMLGTKSRSDALVTINLGPQVGVAPRPGRHSLEHGCRDGLVQVIGGKIVRAAHGGKSTAYSSWVRL